MKLHNAKGSMLMEFILVMPVLVLLIFGIVQISLIWIAKLMTYYAAYSGARTAIVYNPKDYRTGNGNGDFAPHAGPVHRAACTVLAWIGMTSGGERYITIPGWGNIPGSGYIKDQVSVSGEDLQESVNLPAVKVTVSFKFPLLIPYAGDVIGYFAHGGSSEHWDLVGFIPDDMAERRPDSGIGFLEACQYNYIELVETCIMPRPWSTSTFPRAAKNDQTEWGKPE